jgi:putative membrane protein
MRGSDPSERTIVMRIPATWLDPAPPEAFNRADMNGIRLRLVLLAILLALVVVCGIEPIDRSDWILENILVVAIIVLLWTTRRWLPLTDASIGLIFVFLVFHEIGSHYTYAKVPYDAWFENAFGRTLNSMLGFERNHYDRLVHFLFGFLLATPMRELFLRVVRARGFTSYWLPVQMTLSWSAVYEVVEWFTVILFGGELGGLFLGTQGDEFDAQKDMLLAGAGAMFAMGIVAAIHRSRGVDMQELWLNARVKDFRNRCS